MQCHLGSGEGGDGGDPPLLMLAPGLGYIAGVWGAACTAAEGVAGAGGGGVGAGCNAIEGDDPPPLMLGGRAGVWGAACTAREGGAGARGLGGGVGVVGAGCSAIVAAVLANTYR